MKKVVSIILSIFIFLSTYTTAMAIEDSSKYYTVQVEYSDNTGHKETLDVMVQNNNVFVNAKMIAERLGYSFYDDGESATIFNNSSDMIPSSKTEFNYNSTSVSHMIFNYMIDTYKAPFASVKNDKGSWIPLEYSLLLLNSGMMISDGALLIDIPQKRIIDYMYDIQKNYGKYNFDWADDIGYSESDVNVIGGSSHLINIFNGLLEFDGASWKSFFQQFAGNMKAYDKKYGEDLAMLFCTESNKELQATIDNVDMFLELLDDDGELMEILSKKSEITDLQVGSLYEQCEKILQNIDNKNSSLALYNRSYQALEKALDRQTWFSKTGGNILEAQKGINSAAGNAFTFLDIGAKVLEVAGYMQEFQSQDKFSLEALTHYLDSANNGLELPKEMKKSMIEYSDVLSSNFADYTTKRFAENVDQWVIDELPLSEILGTQGASALLAWDIASNVIPFISNGLSDADNFELAMYSGIFQGDAFSNFLSKRDYVFSNEKNITSENLYELSQYCYIYMKSCYITRESALASLSNKTTLYKDKLQPLIDYQNSINDEIAKILVELKNANNTNDGFIFAFLPSDNEKILSEYDDSQLISWIETQQNNQVSDDELTAKYIDFLEAQGYQIYTQDWMYGTPSEYAILDINDDGISELIITGGDDFGFYNFVVLSYDTDSGEIYALPLSYLEDNRDDTSEYIAQYYSSIKYSSNNHALVFTEFNNGNYYGENCFWEIKNTELVDKFKVWFEANSNTNQITYGITDAQGEKSIDKVKFDEYVNEPTEIVFKPIPDNSEQSNIFEAIPQDFVFSSGAGAWRTTIHVSNDGTFTGKFTDSEAGDIGDKCPNGTVYYCDFNGKFSMPQKINEYIYSMNLESLDVEETSGTVYYENGIRYIASDPNGFDNADEFLIYLPGCPLKEIAEEFLSWSLINDQIRDSIPIGVYGIYNVGGKKGFVGEDDNSIWRRTYTYSFHSYRSELQPSYYSESHLNFWPESGAATLVLGFNWSNDDQTEFIASDYRGTGEYNISFDFNEDFSLVTVNVKSISGFNLEPWGGTVDGTLSAKYQVKE